MLFSAQVASLPSVFQNRMSLSTLHNQDHEIMRQKLLDFPLLHKDVKACGFHDRLVNPMARGTVIKCCDPEAVDNPSREPLEKRPGASPPVIESMKSESNRLKSYASRWPLTFIEPSELAAVGLFYLGWNDSVQCAFCHGIISDWEEGDQPLREHVRHFPMCPFLLNCKVGNIPISGSNGKQNWQIEPSRPECGSHIEEPISESPRMVHSFTPKHPAMGSFDKRLESFKDWPISSPLTPSQLAEAGLFYTGDEDIVACFCCGGSLGSWSPGDEAWAEHAKHFPHCSYVNCIKGSQFSENAKQTASAATAVEECCSSVQYAEPAAAQPVMEQLSDTSKQNEISTSGEKEIAHSADRQAKFLCKICMDEGPRAVFVPCGHSLACLKCAANLAACPLCRKKIQSSIRLYFDD